MKKFTVDARLYPLVWWITLCTEMLNDPNLTGRTFGRCLRNTENKVLTLLHEGHYPAK